MSKAVRKQLFEILDTLQQANDMLEGLFIDASNNAMIELLADCQNCAITMGNKIEAVYGEGTESVKALEEYCESIYLVSQSFEQPAMCHQYYVNSKEQLQAVTAHMEREIPDKKEIVFMPYKASMWDSLESVYLAAKEDETCEAYVVPIPYFDRKPDKSLGEMHYEGAEYPKNIPVTDWETYNFEERCPDVTYIHNAYDDMNLVTCVHPRFFSSNLKKYTEELIYIPYFVLEEIEPDDQKKIDNMKHFCVLPGIIHADKVILQSEKMSQIYINEYAKALEAAGVKADREQLKQKFLGLGSPKFDKVVNTKKEDVEVPSEWLRIITKPDGTWKKIVFYNTSVTALLKHEEKMLTKMKNVFEIFKERQDEVALLWRPHPLIRTTIEAMRPQLWEEYAKLVEQYKAEGWGIYDDTADMDRAIALSDAYYGDHSSIVQLCQKAGMPVMVQNVERKPDNFWMLAAYESEGEMFFCAGDFNGIFVKERETQDVKMLGTVPGENLFQTALYYDIQGCENKLYFAPGLADEVAIFNRERRTFEKKSLKYSKECRGKKKFTTFLKHENLMIAIPYTYPALVIIDTSNDKITEYDEWLLALENECAHKLDIIAYSAVIINSGILYVAMQGINVLVEIDLYSKKYTLHTISECDEGFSSIVFDGEDLWLSSISGDIVVWNKDSGVKKIFKNLIEKGNVISVYKSYCNKGNVIFVPRNGDIIVTISIQDYEVKRFKVVDKVTKKSFEFDDVCYGIKLSDNDYWMGRVSGKENIYKIDLNGKYADKVDLFLGNDTGWSVQDIKNNFDMYKNEPVKEKEGIFSLSGLIGIIVNAF